MKKRDFIQHASAQFLAQVDWDVDKSIHYAEKLWQRLNEKGYGDAKPSEMKPTVDAYKTLSPGMKAAFDAFWIAFDYKHNKQRAAMRWQKMGEISPLKLNKIIHAAKKTAEQRKTLPDGQSIKMAEGWLADLRYDDFEETSTEKSRKQGDKKVQAIREVTGDLTHAKKMVIDTDDDFWNEEVKRLTEKLKQLRQRK